METLETPITTLERLAPGYRQEVVKLTNLRPSQGQTIESALQNYPVPFLRTSLNESVPSYTAFNLYSEQQRQKSDDPETSLVVLGGAPGSALGNIHIGLEVAKAMQKQGALISSISAINGSASVDIEGGEFSANPAERAAYMAALIADILPKDPSSAKKHLIINGISLGGLDLGYMYPVLQKLLADKYQMTLIFTQAGGQFDQGVARFGINWLQAMKWESELLRSFPSPADIAEVKNQLREAKGDADVTKEVRLREQLAVLEERRRNLFYLQPENSDNYYFDRSFPGKSTSKQDILTQLRLLDQQIQECVDFNVDPKKLDRLLKQRKDLLFPVIIEKLEGIDERKIGMAKGGLSNLIFKTILAKGGLVEAFPYSLRAILNTDIVQIFGEDDKAFPAEEAKKKNNPEKDFPAAPHIYVATVKKWGHAAAATSSEDYGQIVGDIYWRLNHPSQEKVTTLTYT